MATIPVEKKAATPVWMWLLPLLLLGALLLYFLTRDTDDRDTADRDAAADTTVVMTGPAADGPGPDALDPDNVDGPDAATATGAAAGAAAGTAAGAAANAPAADGGVAADGAAVTSLADLDRLLDDTASARGQLDGRPVTLADARVTSVVGDSAFYVGTGADRVLVVLANVGESERGTDGSDGLFNVDTGDLVGLTGELKSYAAGMRGSGQLAGADRTEAGTRRYVVVTRPNGLRQLSGN